jgi:hypothetical protein
MRVTLFLALIVSFTLACKSKKVQSEAVEKTETNAEVIEKETTGYMNQAEEKLSDTLVARLQRTPCFGRCPIYTVSFYEDGYVLYEGEKWVDREGIYYSHASNKQLNEIREKAKGINFFEMKAQYDNEYVTDLPSTITTIKRKDGFKVVANRYEGPEQLLDLEKLIDEIIDSLEWKKVDSN